MFSTWKPSLRLSAREWLVAGILLLVGLLNLLPGIALVSPARLATLYGVDHLDTDLLVLLRHRALLLALLGGFLILAALRPRWHRTALIAGLLSNVAFVLLALPLAVSTEIHRVAVIDLAALPLLVVGLLLSIRRSPASPDSPHPPDTTASAQAWADAR